MFERMAESAARHPVRNLLVAAVVVIAAAMVGGPVVSVLDPGSSAFQDPEAESSVAVERLSRAAGVDPSPTVIALVATPAGARTEAARERIAAVQKRLEADPAVARVASYADTGGAAFLSRDGRSSYVAAFLRDGADEGDAAERIEISFRDATGVTIGGAAVAQEQVGAQVEEDLLRAEMIAFPLLFLISFWVFRGLVAALLPLVVGGASIIVTFLVLRGINEIDPLSVFALNLTTGLGLGLAIDYSLFMVSRYREELARVGPGVEAMRNTMATAGRTVLFSSLTVAAALASLLVFPLRFLSSMGTAGAVVALVAAAVSLLVLPAILALLGERVNALSPSRWRRAALAQAGTVNEGFWYRLSRAVMRRPGRVAAASAIFLIALGIPFLSVRFTGVDAGVLPTERSARVVDDALRADFDDFGSGRTAPIVVAAQARSGDRAAVAAFARAAGRLDGVAAVSAPRLAGRDLWQVDVAPRGGERDEATKDLVRGVRALPAPFAFEAGGPTAEQIDRERSIRQTLPLALAIIGITTFVLLFAMTGSVVLPVKALIMNLLTVSAAFGMLVLVFQDGRLEGLLDYTSQGALEMTQPMLLFALAFGLSTDYGVFLLTRIKEARDSGLENSEAVAVGLERTGRIVTAAALLFTVAMGSFATSEIIFIKEVGVGTALAVLIDATIVRALLVPALMGLLGEWNWWSPRFLRRVYERSPLREAAPGGAPL